MRSERGQATVEVALVLPLLVALALAMVWIGVVAAHQLAVVDAARVGARTAATGGDTAAVAAAAGAAAPGLDRTRLDVSVARDAGRVTVHVRYREDAPLAVLSRLVPAVELSDDESEVDESDEHTQMPRSGSEVAKFPRGDSVGEGE